MCENCYVVPLSWASSNDADVNILRVHWIPLTVDINLIKAELEKYVTCVKEERNNFNFMSGRNMPTGKVSFKVVLKKDVKAEDIPHVTKIFNMEALITMPGRSPLCLNCGLLGHISRDCKLRFCSVCNRMANKEHSCSLGIGVRTFADVVRKRDDDVDPDDWGDGILFEKDITLEKEKSSLAGKISGLEFRLRNVLEENAEHVEARREKKRKVQPCSSSKNPEISVEDAISDGGNAQEVMAWSEDQEYLSSEDEFSEGAKISESVESAVVVEGDKPLKVKEEKKTTGDVGKVGGSKLNRSRGNVSSNQGEGSIRSSARLKVNKARKPKEQVRLDKIEIENKREFVFTD